MKKIIITFAILLMSMIANVVLAQTPTTFEPTQLTAEEKSAIELQIENATELSKQEINLFKELLENGNQPISFYVAKKNIIPLTHEGDKVETSILRSETGFFLLHRIETPKGLRGRSRSAVIEIL